MAVVINSSRRFVIFLRPASAARASSNRLRLSTKASTRFASLERITLSSLFHHAPDWPRIATSTPKSCFLTPGASCPLVILIIRGSPFSSRTVSPSASTFSSSLITGSISSCSSFRKSASFRARANTSFSLMFLPSLAGSYREIRRLSICFTSTSARSPVAIAKAIRRTFSTLLGT